MDPKPSASETGRPQRKRKINSLIFFDDKISIPVKADRKKPERAEINSKKTSSKTASSTNDSTVSKNIATSAPSTSHSGSFQ